MTNGTRPLLCERFLRFRGGHSFVGRMVERSLAVAASYSKLNRKQLNRMRRKPRIPLNPGEAPQQRLYRVVDLPSLSEPFPCAIHFVSELTADDHPRLIPRNARLVGMVEWSWSPMHSRFEAYYLSTNRKRSHWLLWMLWPDEWGNLAPFRETNLCAYGPKGRIEPKAAAAHLLLAWWRYGSWAEELDHFHMIDDEGLLKVEDLMAIGRLVWTRYEKSGEEDE